MHKLSYLGGVQVRDALGNKAVIGVLPKEFMALEASRVPNYEICFLE